MRWVSTALFELRDKLTARSIDELLLTKRYWLLLSLVGQVVAPLKDIVQTEVDERRRGFTEAIGRLRAAQERWTDGAVFVLDTNVYMHAPLILGRHGFVDIFASGATGPIRILLPAVVTEELDNLKYRGNDRGRAQVTLAIVDRVLGEQPRVPAEPAEVSDDGNTSGRSSIIELDLDPLNHVRLASNDAELIDRTLSYQFASTSPVTLVTYDTHMATRARALGLTVRKLAKPSS